MRALSLKNRLINQFYDCKIILLWILNPCIITVVLRRKSFYLLFVQTAMNHQQMTLKNVALDLRFTLPKLSTDTSAMSGNIDFADISISPLSNVLDPVSSAKLIVNAIYEGTKELNPAIIGNKRKIAQRAFRNEPNASAFQHQAYLQSDLNVIQLALDTAVKAFEENIYRNNVLDRPIKIVDWGSGDGIVLMFASLGYGFQGDGFEADPELYDIACAIASKNRIPDVTFHRADFLSAQSKNYDLVFYFDGGSTLTRPANYYRTLTNGNAVVLQRLLELRPGSQFVVTKNAGASRLFDLAPFLDEAVIVVNPHPHKKEALIYTRNDMWSNAEESYDVYDLLLQENGIFPKNEYKERSLEIQERRCSFVHSAIAPEVVGSTA